MEALPVGAREKLKSLYDYVENSILFPLRMVDSPKEADEEFEELISKYERIRVTINTLLLDSLGRGLMRIYKRESKENWKIYLQKTYSLPTGRK